VLLWLLEMKSIRVWSLENTKIGDMKSTVRSRGKGNRTQAKDERSIYLPSVYVSVEELIGYMSSDEESEITPKTYVFANCFSTPPRDSRRQIKPKHATVQQKK
jgi:hypothetical protein